ncbi:MAG: 6,7-dimethyl-8-ribityllumazine synthase, partial [Proteobacteria bacterium]|nr:6,7-dimethyl-8-ribityllumazine synthase [Pseudomonadota bacterium]
LSLSSTAFQLQLLDEKGEITTRHGRLVFSVLLFQDLAAIPLIALVPLFVVGSAEQPAMDLGAAALAIGTILGVIVVGRFNHHVVDSLVEGAVDSLVRHGVDAENIDIVHVPGAWELPLAVKRALQVARPDAVIAGMRRALKPGGRLVAEFGGGDNVATVKAALIDGLNRRGLDGESFVPWYFPDDAAYRARLEAGGFTVDDIALIERPTPLPGPIGDWLDTFCESFLFALPEGDRAALKAEVAEALRPSLCDAAGIWSVDYVRLRVIAHVAEGP